MLQSGVLSRKRFTRRQFLFGIGAGAFCFGGYAKFLEPTWLEIGRHKIEVPWQTALAPLKILHLSDLHASHAVELDFINDAISVGLGLKPDLVLVTGDFVTSRHDRMEEYAKILSRLVSAAPTYASLGNHDGGRWVSARGGYFDTTTVRGLIARSGIELLHNEARALQIKGRDVHVVGLGDVWASEFHPEWAFAMPPAENSVTLVLSHNPDSKDRLKDYPWHAMFCGHTHGGQFRMPVIGTPFAPVKDKRFIAGLYSWNDRWIHITKGVGNVHGVRFNCRPEVSLVTLV